MNRVLKISTILLLIITLLPFNIIAVADFDESISTYYFDDGSYMTVTVSQNMPRSTSVKGNKVFNFYGSDGVEQWRAELIGIFTYDGTTATCTSCVCNVTITDTDWSYTQKRCYVNGGSALCDLTMVKKWLGITIRTEEMTLSLTCSPTGQLT